MLSEKFRIRKSKERKYSRILYFKIGSTNVQRLLIGQSKPRNFVYFFSFIFAKDRKTGVKTGWVSKKKNQRIFVLRRRLKFNNYPTAILLRYNTTITSEKMPAQVTIPWEYVFFTFWATQIKVVSQDTAFSSTNTRFYID